MKKSSIFVTILLVVALCFAVSCPKGPQVSITSDADITKNATVGEALEAFTFEIEVVNGAFVSDAKGQTLTIKGLDQFNASGTGAEAKATATATISNLADADATTKKITKATVTVSGFTAKAATQGAKDLTFEIPEIKTDAKKYLEDTTSAVAIGGRKVSITASNPVQKVEVVVAPTSREFTAGSVISADNTVTFTLTGAKWKESEAPTISTDNGLTFAVVRTSDTVMTLTVTGTPTAVADAKDYSFVIKDFVDVATGYTLDDTLKASISVTVKAAAPAKSNATFTVSGSPIEFTAASEDTTGQDVTISLDGAKVKSGITADSAVTYTEAITGVSAKIKTATAGANSLVITFTADNTTSTTAAKSVAIDLKQYVEASDDQHQIPESFSASVSVEIK